MIGGRWNIRPFVDGQYLDSSSTEAVDNINPATEEVLCQIPAGSPQDIHHAVETSRRRFVQGVWSQLGPDERKNVLYRFAELIAAHQEELAALDSLEMGKPISAARFEAGIMGPIVVRAAAEWTDKICGTLVPSEPSTLSFSVYQPRGVIAAIVPWNFPTYNMLLKIAPALTVGNAVVLKPSELASGSALKLAELAIEAGLPAGVLNVVPGLGKTVGEALASHPDVDMVSFTGSTATGRRVMQLATQGYGKPVQLECGGKSPQLVFADVDDLDRVAASAAQDIFYNSGQVCAARSRLIVEKSIKERLLKRIVAIAREVKPGNPAEAATSFGPLVSASQQDKVWRWIERGVEEGAQLLVGEAKPSRTSKGYFVPPTIFDHVHADAAILREEIFGPVLCVQTFKDESEAIALANATEYGLTANAWTRDFGRAKRLARALDAGFVTIRTSGEEGSGANLASVLAVCAEPHKASGFGAEWGLKGLEAYSKLKAVQMLGG